MKPIIDAKHILIRAVWVFILAAFAAALQYSYSMDVAPRGVTVAGYPGEAAIIQKNGRWYVDLEMLARILKGELSRQDTHILLRLRHVQSEAANATAGDNSNLPAVQASSFSPEFVNAGIETLFSMRSWAATVSDMIAQGFPIEASAIEHQHQTTKNLAYLNAASRTDGDRAVFELMTNEFNHLQSWSKHLTEAKKAMRTGHYAMSPDGLSNDEESKRIVRCWQFLGPLLAGGRFHDDGSCR